MRTMVKRDTLATDANTVSFEHYGSEMTYPGWTATVTRTGDLNFDANTATPISYTDFVRVAMATQTPTNPAPVGVAYHKFYRQTQLLFSELYDEADWGYWYYSTSNVMNLTHQSGADVNVRAQFIHSGFLSNTEDTMYRAINDHFPVFAFAVDLGSVGATAVNTLFTIGLTQEHAVQFQNLPNAQGVNGTSPVPSLWTSYYPTELQAVRVLLREFGLPSTVIAGRH